MTTPQQTAARAIYETLLQLGPMTTSEVIQVTKKNRATALAVIQRLMSVGVIKVSGKRKTRARGRPANLLIIDPLAEPREIPQ